MDTTHEPPANIFNFIATVLLLAVGHFFDWFKTNDPIVEFVTWLAQMGAWGSAWVVGFVTFLNFLNNHGWINLNKWKKPKQQNENFK